MRKKLSSTKKPLKNLLYQDDFAAEMVELEIIIACNNFSLNHVQKLMKSYARAVDYYVAIQSDYYLYFENKMKSLLLLPKVLGLINDGHEKKKNKKNSKKKKKKKKKN